MSNADASRWLPYVRIKVARTEILPMGNSKFWGLVGSGRVRLRYLDGTPYAETASIFELMDRAPSETPVPERSRRRRKPAHAETA